MNLRLTQHFRLIAVFALATALAGSAMWLNMVMKRSASIEAKSLAPDRPDYSFHNFRYFRIKANQSADYKLTGREIAHYPGNDSYLVKFPVMETLDKRQRLQVAYSDWAYLEDENSKMHMHENVVVLRPPTKETEAFRLTTEYLLYFPDEEVMRTDIDVKILKGEADMSAIGMESNNATREIFLLDRAKVVYPPAKSRK